MDLKHGQNQPDASEQVQTVARNARIGLVLFAVYLLLFSAFVLTIAFAPAVMERKPLFGINLAILSGFGLILTAFVLALLYGWLCRTGPHRTGPHDDQTGGQR